MSIAVFWRQNIGPWQEHSTLGPKLGCLQNGAFMGTPPEHFKVQGAIDIVYKGIGGFQWFKKITMLATKTLL